ncbi:acyltransferase family protein [Vibrio cholerae]|nr:acyltransferase family protein [Vibrio cholerae]
MREHATSRGRHRPPAPTRRDLRRSRRLRARGGHRWHRSGLPVWLVLVPPGTPRFPARWTVINTKGNERSSTFRFMSAAPQPVALGGELCTEDLPRAIRRPASDEDPVHAYSGHRRREARISGTGSTRIGWLDSLRGVAILLVVVLHAGEALRMAVGPTPAVDQFNLFFEPFRMPVLMFLSGVLLPQSVAKPGQEYFAGKVSMVAWPYLLWSLIILAASGDLRPAALGQIFYLSPTYLWYLWFILVFYALAYPLRRLPPLVAAVPGSSYRCSSRTARVQRPWPSSQPSSSSAPGAPGTQKRWNGRSPGPGFLPARVLPPLPSASSMSWARTCCTGRSMPGAFSGDWPSCAGCSHGWEPTG